MELDCQRMEATPPEMRPVFYFLTSFSGNVGLGGKPGIWEKEHFSI